MHNQSFLAKLGMWPAVSSIFIIISTGVFINYASGSKKYFDFRSNNKPIKFFYKYTSWYLKLETTVFQAGVDIGETSLDDSRNCLIREERMNVHILRKGSALIMLS